MENFPIRTCNLSSGLTTYRHVGEARRSPTLVRDAQNNGHTSEAAKRTRMTQQRHGAPSHLAEKRSPRLIASWPPARGRTALSRRDGPSDQSEDASITLIEELVSVTQSRRRPAREIRPAYSRWVRSRPGSNTTNIFKSASDASLPQSLSATHALDENDPSFRPQRSRTVRENQYALVVVPIVNDVFEKERYRPQVRT